MTRPRTEDDLLEFKRLVRWLTGATLTQADAEVELAAIEARYGAVDKVLVNVVVDDGPIKPIVISEAAMMAAKNLIAEDPRRGGGAVDAASDLDNWADNAAYAKSFLADAP